MDLHSQFIYDEFVENLDVFKKVKDIVLGCLSKDIKELGFYVNVVEGRVKTPESLKGKLAIKGYKYNSIFDITDIVGCRVVTYYDDEIDKISARVTSEFEIDWDNSVDKRNIYKVDQFGYRSLHYICRIPKELYFDENHPEINQIRFEIQIKTILQHAWAMIAHDTGYKSDVEIPQQYLRSLNRLASLLELADKEFLDFRNSINDYRRQVRQIVKNGNYADVELNKDSFENYIEAGVVERVNKHIASINNMEIESASLYAFLKIFKSFGFETLRDLDDCIKENDSDAYKMAIYFFEGTDLDIMSETTGLLFICYCTALKKGRGQEGIVEILDTVNGKRKTNERFANKILQIGKKMGLVKEA